MTFEQLKAACDLVWEKRNKNSTLCISFFGGEPSLEWPNIRKIVDYNNEQGRIIEYNMTTNFTYPFTDDDLEWIANENFGFLVSIDGNKKTKGLLRRAKDILMPQLENARDKGTKILKKEQEQPEQGE